MGNRNSKFNNLYSAIYAQEMILPGENEAELEKRYQRWVARLGARTDRRRRVDTNALRDLVETTAETFYTQKEQEARALVDRLAHSPTEAAHGLRNSTAGLNWMLGQVTLLEEQLATHCGFQPTQAIRAIHLCGKRPGDLFDDHDVWHWQMLQLAVLVRDDTPTIDLAVMMLEPDQPGDMGTDEFRSRLETLIMHLPTRDEAHAQLKKKVAKLRAELTERLELIALKEERDLARAIENAKFDARPQGDKRRQAENSLDRLRRASLKELRAQQKARCEEDPPDPEPDAPGAGPRPHCGARGTGRYHRGNRQCRHNRRGRRGPNRAGARHRRRDPDNPGGRHPKKIKERTHLPFWQSEKRGGFSARRSSLDPAERATGCLRAAAWRDLRTRRRRGRETGPQRCLVRGGRGREPCPRCHAHRSRPRRAGDPGHPSRVGAAVCRTAGRHDPTSPQ
jgi:hypothetical protein